MKTQFIDDLKPGDFVDDVFMLSEKNMAQKRDGNNYLNVTLADKTGRIRGVVWDNVDQITNDISSGDFVHVSANVGEYKGVMQLVVRKITPFSADEVDPAEFLPTSRRNIDAMLERLQALGNSLEADHIKSLLNAFWDDPEFIRRFKTAPAAKKMHHAYIGGLLEHTLSMASLADKVAAHYSGVNRDLLIAGAILHDIGKTKELEYTFNINYSDQGRLLSHIVIGIEMIEEKAAAIEKFPKEQKLLLKHMVISHHGSREFGSPEPPKTIEAVLLNYIDEMDSKVNGIRDFIASEDSTENWTSYHRLLERHFYRGQKEID